MACEKQVGVRNIFITLKNCDDGTTYGPYVHELASDEQPQMRLCPFTNEALPGGYVRRARGNNQIQLNVVRNPEVPLAAYQGCAELDIVLEYFSGRVVTALGGTHTGEDTSDGHEVSIDAAFAEVDERLVRGAA